MNVANRTSFISQRLDDYPSLYDNYLMENDEWWNWWQEQDYEKRADLAAFIFDSNDTIESEEDKLAYISEVVNAEKVQVGDSLDSDVIKEKIRSEGLNAYSAQLMDDRRIYLGFHGSLKESRMAIQEDSSAFMSQLQAGLEGYVLILHEGEIYVSPQ